MSVVQYSTSAKSLSLLPVSLKCQSCIRYLETVSVFLVWQGTKNPESERKKCRNCCNFLLPITALTIGHTKQTGWAAGVGIRDVSEGKIKPMYGTRAT